MPAETIFNLFVYVDRGVISELGFTVHNAQGSDAEKIALLQACVEVDHKTARRLKLAKPMDWDRYEAMMRLGRQLHPFEPVFVECGASREPLSVVTPIVDGAPKILAVIPWMGPVVRDDFKGTQLEEQGEMVDYLQKYATRKGFDGPRLLHDDHFKAIKLLFNAGHYVSTGKLRAAIGSLARELGAAGGAGALLGAVEDARVFDWARDPFARGAYSWVPVGGVDAPAALAAPLGGCLFFAGEATDTGGDPGTVHGALATGARAAAEIAARLRAR